MTYLHPCLLGVLLERPIVECGVGVSEDLQSEINNAGSDSSLAGQDNGLALGDGEATPGPVDLCQLVFRQETIVGVHDGVKRDAAGSWDVRLVKEFANTTI